METAERWEHWEHGADVGVRGVGPDPARAFAGAARALFALVTPEPEALAEREERAVACEAGNLEELLADFLNELVYLFDAERLVLGHFEVSIREGEAGRLRLRATARGEAYDPERHESTVEPKGATYTGLRVEERGGRWVAECVIDV